MAAVTMANMISNKDLIIITSKFDHADFIGNHYFWIGRKIKKKVSQEHPPPLLSLKNIHSWQLANSLIAYICKESFYMINFFGNQSHNNVEQQWSVKFTWTWGRRRRPHEIFTILRSIC